MGARAAGERRREAAVTYVDRQARGGFRCFRVDLRLVAAIAEARREGEQRACNTKLCAACARHVGPQRDLCPRCDLVRRQLQLSFGGGK